jgi:hypothetical protein
VLALLAADAAAAYQGVLLGWGPAGPGGWAGPAGVLLTLGAAALAYAGLRVSAARPVRPPRVLAAAAVALALVGLIALAAGRFGGGRDSPRPASGGGAPPDLVGVSKKWSIPPGKDGKRTLVVVTASGGGIQASAWTARVLTGLHERYGPGFTNSVKLVSAVSGGSLGAAWYLGHWQDSDDPFPSAGSLRAVNEDARRHGLDASTWGMAFPDLLRLALPPLAPPEVDRGWALEESWRRRLGEGRGRGGDWRLRDLAGPPGEGRMPVVVFNATLAETGQRLLISPVVREAVGPVEEAHAGRLRPPGAVEFLHLFGEEADPRVATAVRLSATFPFVSPIPRARRKPDPPTAGQWDGLAPEVRDSFGGGRGEWEAAAGLREYLRNCHVVDGGYVDNEGAFTAAEWVKLLWDYYHPDPAEKPARSPPAPPFDRVVFVRIVPFPNEAARGADPADWRPGRAGWANEFTGPVTALEHVRVTSQAERNSLGLELLEGYVGRREAARAVAHVGALARRLGDRVKPPAGRGPDDAQMPDIRRGVEDIALAAGPAGGPGPFHLAKVQFVFQPRDAGGGPVAAHVTPLSWNLTPGQRADIDRAWAWFPDNAADANNPLSTLDRLFAPR